MMKMGHIACLFFAKFAIVVLCIGPHQIFSRELPSSSDLIKKACESTMYKDLCKNTLLSFPESDKADLHELVKRSLKYASSNGSSINQEIKQWARTSNDDEYAQQCFHDCSQSYEDAVEQLEDSMAVLDTKEYSNVQAWIAAAMSDVDQCQDGCNIDSKVTNLNTAFSQLCSNVLALVNILAA